MLPCREQKGKEIGVGPLRQFDHMREWTSKAAFDAMKRYITLAKRCLLIRSLVRSADPVVPAQMVFVKDRPQQSEPQWQS